MRSSVEVQSPCASRHTPRDTTPSECDGASAFQASMRASNWSILLFLAYLAVPDGGGGPLPPRTLILPPRVLPSGASRIPLRSDGRHRRRSRRWHAWREWPHVPPQELRG